MKPCVHHARPRKICSHCSSSQRLPEDRSRKARTAADHSVTRRWASEVVPPALGCIVDFLRWNLNRDANHCGLPLTGGPCLAHHSLVFCRVSQIRRRAAAEPHGCLRMLHIGTYRRATTIQSAQRVCYAGVQPQHAARCVERRAGRRERRGLSCRSDDRLSQSTSCTRVSDAGQAPVLASTRRVHPTVSHESTVRLASRIPSSPCLIGHDWGDRRLSILMLQLRLDWPPLASR